MPTMTMTQKAASDIAHAQKLVDEILAKEENPTKRRLLRGVMAAYRRQHLHYLKLPDEKALAAIRADKYYSSMTHLPGSDERLRQDVLHIASMKAAEKPAPKPKQSKPKQSKPRQSKPSARRPVFGSPPPSAPKKPTRKAEYTPKQRALIREIFRYEREIEHTTDRMLHSHGTARSPEDEKLSDLRGKQREAELKLYRLNKSAAEKTQARITERNNKYHNRRVRDTKKKHAFASGRFSSGTDYLN